MIKRLLPAVLLSILTPAFCQSPHMQDDRHIPIPSDLLETLSQYVDEQPCREFEVTFPHPVRPMEQVRRPFVLNGIPATYFGTAADSVPHGGGLFFDNYRITMGFFDRNEAVAAISLLNMEYYDREGIEDIYVITSNGKDYREMKYNGSGELIAVCYSKNREAYREPAPEQKARYRFEVIKTPVYRYMGETIDGKPDGYGIRVYFNGSRTFGYFGTGQGYGFRMQNNEITTCRIPESF